MLFSLMKFLPGRPWIILIALLGVVYGLLSEYCFPSFKPTLLKDKYPDMSQGATIVDFSYMAKPVSSKALLIGSLEVAFVAVLETLISARIADNLTGTRFDQSREVFGMSLANMLSGIMGGTPCTGVLVRTGVNVASGATDKMSQLINAVSVLAIVMILLPIFTYIPMPVIASILMTSAFRLVPIKIMSQLLNEDMPEFFILIFTTCVCIFGDGCLGLLAGGFAALMRNAAANNYGYVSFQQEGSTLVASISGQLSYINALDVEICITDKAKSSSIEYVIVDLSNLKFIDIDGIECLKFISKISATKRIGFTKMKGNTVFDKSEFVNNSCFFENLNEATEKTQENGPNTSEELETLAYAEGGVDDDEYARL